MHGPQLTFKRYEEKYMLTEKQYAMLLEKMSPYMNADEYGESTICNIYYDTKDYSLIRRSLDKPVYKEKFRIRSYGVPCEDSEVFVEIKKKYKGVVYKRRVGGSLAETKAFLEDYACLADNEQIQKEIRWFLDYYRPEPKMFIGYERRAFFGREDHEFRLTFDRNIRYRKDSLRLEAGDMGTHILPDGIVLMELKTMAGVPEWMVEYLSSERIYPVSFSKYGTCYITELKNSGLEEQNIKSEEREFRCLTAF